MAKGMVFTGWCVRALLEGRKFQTMRIIRPQPQPSVLGVPVCEMSWNGRANLATVAPYQPGDIIYVQEALCNYNDWAYYASTRTVVDAGGAELIWRWKRDYLRSTCMPREAARMFRRILGVRAMRVQEITADEVQAEGVNVVAKLPVMVPPGTTADQLDAIAKAVAHHLFAPLWDDLQNKPGERFADSPMAYRYKFEKVEGEDVASLR